MSKLALAILGGALAVTAAGAQTQEQRYGYNAIQRADLAGAEARLIAERAAQPDEPSVLINLAHIYSKTGRAPQAEALYRQVLASANVMMLTGGNRPLSSHQLARQGLDRAKLMASR